MLAYETLQDIARNAFLSSGCSADDATLLATICTDNTCADQHGIGAVTLRETNHWARPGWYGLRAAKRGYGLICWTNTMPNLPFHDGTRQVLGNNPVVIAVPGNPED